MYAKYRAGWMKQSNIYVIICNFPFPFLFCSLSTLFPQAILNLSINTFKTLNACLYTWPYMHTYSWKVTQTIRIAWILAYFLAWEQKKILMKFNYNFPGGLIKMWSVLSWVLEYPKPIFPLDFQRQHLCYFYYSLYVQYSDAPIHAGRLCAPTLNTRTQMNSADGLPHPSRRSRCEAEGCHACHCCHIPFLEQLVLFLIWCFLLVAGQVCGIFIKIAMHSSGIMKRWELCFCL